MKKYILILTLILSSVGFAAQDEKLDELPFKEEETIEESPKYFSVAGGITGTLLFLNNEVLNTDFLKPNGWKEFDSPMFLTGGQGFTALPWVPNLRLGINGFGGTTTSTTIASSTISGNSVDLQREATNSFSSLGISVGYGIIVLKSVAVIPEFTLGLATHEVKFNQYLSGDKTHPVVPGNDPNVYINTLSRNFLNLNLGLNVEWAFSSVGMFRVSGGYALGFSGDWQWNGQTKVNDVDKGINTNAPYLQFGIFLGLFNY